jgi:AGZA family xanthine/uracil permease-like MFS transporter
MLVFIFGLMTTGALVARKQTGALVIGIFATTFFASLFGRFGIAGPVMVEMPTDIVAAPDFSLLAAIFMNQDYTWVPHCVGAVGADSAACVADGGTWSEMLDFTDPTNPVGAGSVEMDVGMPLIESLKFAVLPAMFAFLFTDMFDSISTFVGVSEVGGLNDENGEPRNIKEALIVDGASTTISGLLGSSPGTSYIESAAGIEAGGRSGLTAAFAGLLFIPFLFLSPVIGMVPLVASAPILVLVGLFMCKPIAKIDWGNFENAFPAFMAMILVPLTFSITQGIIWGFLSWSAIKICVGKFDQITIPLWCINVFSLLALLYAD